MLISELEERLKKIKTDHGDLKVMGGMYQSYVISPLSLKGLGVATLMKEHITVIEFEVWNPNKVNDADK